MRDREEAFPTAVAQGTLPLPWEEQGNSVEEITYVLGEVADFRRWAASMRQLHTSNAIAAQFGGDALLSRKGAACAQLKAGRKDMTQHDLHGT